MPGWTWNRIYLLLAAMWIPLMVAVILAREGKQRRERFKEAEEKYEKTLAETVRPGLGRARHGLAGGDGRGAVQASSSTRTGSGSG